MPLHPPDEVERDFRAAFAAERRDAVVFTLTTLLLAPLFLGLAVLGVVFVAGSSRVARHVTTGDRGLHRALATAITAGLIWLFIAFFASPRPGRRTKQDLAWVLGAMACVAATLLLTYATPLPTEWPVVFWLAYAALAITMLGLLGHAYEPRDDYYLGWAGGRMDDPFTFRDDLDRGHIALGCATAIPRLLFGSAAGIVGSSWLFRGLDDAEIRGAAELLHALGAHDGPAVERALRRPAESLARLLRALDKMKLVRRREGRLELTTDGEKLVGTSQWV
jgi:hypothetical protein